MAQSDADEALNHLLRQAHDSDAEAADRACAVLYAEPLKITCARLRLRLHQAPTMLDIRGLIGWGNS
jgi:hypothetical protein